MKYVAAKRNMTTPIIAAMTTIHILFGSPTNATAAMTLSIANATSAIPSAMTVCTNVPPRDFASSPPDACARKCLIGSQSK